MSDQFLALAGSTVDDLLERLADASTVGGLPFDRDRKRLIGLSIFKGWTTQFRETLCGQHLRLSGSDKAEDVARDAAAVADILLSVADQLPLATVSVLIVKYGLDQICDEHNQ